MIIQYKVYISEFCSEIYRGGLYAKTKRKEILMKLLEDIITSEGKVYPGNILKVDAFLNHQIDVSLLDRLGNEFYQRFKDKEITKILTIEASGIAIACAAARLFEVPVVFAKKSQSLNIGNDVYVTRISSYTYNKDYDVTVSTISLLSATR